MGGSYILAEVIQEAEKSSKTIAFIADAFSGKAGIIWYLLTSGILTFVFVQLVLHFLRKFFAKLRENKQSIHIRFFERLLQVIVVIVGLLSLLFGYIGTQGLWKTLFGSTVLIGGIIGIAGQDVLKDIISGLMLSFYKPFNLGDRLYITNVPRPVIVEDMTMRHVVFRARDGMRFIMPNSEVNKQVITHTNIDHKNRATYLYVPVSYGSDLRKAIKLMRQAARECPYTCSNDINKDLAGYGDAYLASIGESAMMMEMTIWSEPGMDNDLVVSEVYQGIVRLFAQNGIEIPYNFVNVVNREDEGMFYDEGKGHVAIRELSTRTDTVNVRGNLAESVTKVVEEASKFAEFHSLKSREQSTIELLSEELLSFMDDVSGEAVGRFWIEGNRSKISIHMRSTMSISPDKRKDLLGISRDGKNSVMLGIVGRVQGMIFRGMSEIGGVSFSLKESGELKNTDGLEKVLIVKLSDDVQVSVLGDRVEIVIIKKFE